MTTPRPEALRELVQARLAELALSYGDVARAGKIPKATVAHLATGDRLQVPRPETIVGLARGLQLPVSTIQAAIAEAVGLSPGGATTDRTTDLVVRTLAELDEQQREILAASLLAAAAAMRKQRDHPAAEE